MWTEYVSNILVTTNYSKEYCNTMNIKQFCCKNRYWFPSTTDNITCL